VRFAVPSLTICRPGLGEEKGLRGRWEGKKKGGSSPVLFDVSGFVVSPEWRKKGGPNRGKIGRRGERKKRKGGSLTAAAASRDLCRCYIPIACISELMEEEEEKIGKRGVRKKRKRKKKRKGFRDGDHHSRTA